MKAHPMLLIVSMMAFIFAAGLMSGMFAQNLVVKLNGQLPSNARRFKETRLSENFKYINPLLECDNAIQNSPETTQLEDKIRQYISETVQAGSATTAAVYYRDLNNGPWFGVNQDADFSPASLLKLPLAITYYKAAEKNPEILSQKIINDLPNTESFYTSVVVKPQYRLVFGTEYSVETLIRQMTSESDNLAYQLLFDSIDSNLMKSTSDELGVDTTKSSDTPTGNIVSVMDYATFFRILYNSSYLMRDSSEKLLSLMAESNFKDGIVAGVPTNVPVAHKFGERLSADTGEWQLHDCGIVYKKQDPYLLCVMTKGTDFKELSKMIQRISNLVYIYLNK